MKDRDKIIEACKDELLKHLFPVIHKNGYPCEAVPKATILELPALMRNHELLEQPESKGEKEIRKWARSLVLEIINATPEFGGEPFVQEFMDKLIEYAESHSKQKMREKDKEINELKKQIKQCWITIKDLTTN